MNHKSEKTARLYRERMVRVRRAIAQKNSLLDAATAEGITPSGLHLWLKSKGHEDLLAQLNENRRYMNLPREEVIRRLKLCKEHGSARIVATHCGVKVHAIWKFLRTYAPKGVDEALDRYLTPEDQQEMAA
ncbi:MAG: hypothetical protein AAF292_16365 [Pseudomonadota bacterium]